MDVKIYKPSKNTMQSGYAKTSDWVLEHDTDNSRAPEPLMGWASASDTLNQICLNFNNCDDAIAFAENKNWNYTVTTENERCIKPRNYSDNFK